MAFCPECGKAVTPDAAVCSSCGKQIRSPEKKGRAGRFHGTMMMTAPEVQPEQPANVNAQPPVEQANAVASAAGMTSPRTRSGRPASAKQGGNLGQNAGRPSPLQLRGTMVGAGAAPDTAAKKPAPRHATMLGAALPPTVPRSKPPVKASVEPEAQPIPGRRAPAQPMAESDRRPVILQTTPQATSSPSVRAVQSLPVRPSTEGAVQPRREPMPAVAPVSHGAKAVPSPVPPRGSERKSPNPARVVHAIPEVEATVVDRSELPSNVRTVPREYLPGDPMAPQPPAAMRAPRPREHPFAPEHPEEAGRESYILLYWAVCVAVVAAVCAFAFRLF